MTKAKAKARAFQFDAAGLAAEEPDPDGTGWDTAADAIDPPGARGAALEMFAAEVHGRLAADVRGRMAAADPASIVLLIVGVVSAIVAACRKKQVAAALAAYRDRPRSLRSMTLQHRVARRLPPKYGDDRHQLARQIVATGADALDSDLWDAAWTATEDPS